MKTIFIIGTGNMGGAIARALSEKHRVYAFDKHSQKAKIKGVIFDRGLKNLSRAGYVIIAVKPQDLIGLAKQIKLDKKTVLISIAAGARIAKIQKLFRHKSIVRMMPNLGLKVGMGIAGWKAAGLTAVQKLRTKKLLDDFTENFEVRNESDIDAITAVSGSGPAYFFYLAFALESAAKKLGFNGRQARKLAEKTFSAAAGLQIGKAYQTLIKQVASKKGTTEAALRIFKKYRLEKIITLAVEAAEKRARQLSNG